MKVTALILTSTFLGWTGAALSQTVQVNPAELPRIATVDERYQSYNVEMAEVVGGQFWMPYEQLAAASNQRSSGAGGAPPQPGTTEFYDSLKSPLPPIDLSDTRLRKLASVLGPAYVRVSGITADSVYFHDSDDPPPATPPEGFTDVLTRQQWRGVVDFARAVNAELVTSFAVSAGTRDANGVWQPDQARKLIEYTRSIGGKIHAAEFFNEPTGAGVGIGGLPPGYDAADYARDFAIFRQLAESAAPDMLVLGPSAVGEGPVELLTGDLIHTEDILTATPRPEFDGFSYHAYGASSMRCAAPGKLTTTKDAALSEEWLATTEQTYHFYAALRDRYQPGTPMWLTETAEAACGGNPWAKTFLDTFRYLDQQGRLGKHGLHTVMHNTLATSEYALIDRETMEPRPNYWAAVLWRRLMGTTALNSGVPIREGMHLYANCQPGQSGGVTLLAINNSRTEAETINLPMAAERYTLTAQELDGEQVQLNGNTLELQTGHELPELNGEPVPAGQIEIAPASITFLTIADAGNTSCR